MWILLLWAAKALAVAVGAYVGYVAGLVLSYYVGDHGDVGSAYWSIVLIPIAVLVCSTIAYIIAAVALRNFQ